MPGIFSLIIKQLGFNDRGQAANKRHNDIDNSRLDFFSTIHHSHTFSKL